MALFKAIPSFVQRLSYPLKSNHSIHKVAGRLASCSDKELEPPACIEGIVFP